MSESPRSRSSSRGARSEEEEEEEEPPQPQPHRFVSSSGSTSGRRLRILAYGDSLTAGFHDRGRSFAPDGAALAKALSPDIEAEVWVCGLSGMTAREMVERLRKKKVRDRLQREGKGLQSILEDSESFDLAVIMAGTNDLGALKARRGCTADVCTDVRALHAACHEFGLRTVVLTVPTNKGVAKVQQAESVPAVRREYFRCWSRVNEALQEWAQGSGREDGVVLCVDTAELVPFDALFVDSCWEGDGLHFSPQGSKQLGEGLAARLAPLLRDLGDGAAGDSAAPQRRAPRWRVPMPECILAATPPHDATRAMRRRVLAYGDSLTAGYWAAGNLFSPYAESLVAALVPHVQVEALVCGLSGLTAEEMAEGLDAEVLEDCIERKGKGLRRILQEHGPFDAVLIMAGTNDLGEVVVTPSDIAASLTTLHAACHAAGVHTVALSVPTSKFAEIDIQGEADRRKVNKLLREWADTHKGGTDAAGSDAGVVCVVDTVELLPYSKDNGCWEADGLHFSKMGSQQFGMRLAEQLQQPLSDLPPRNSPEPEVPRHSPEPEVP